MPSTEPDNRIHVAVAVVENARAEILITKRPEHLHQGGLWEFPGGKLEQGEDVFAALQRELKEEVGIHIESAQPLIQIPFHYPEQSVLLDVFQVSRFSGPASGLEGQVLQWVSRNKLNAFSFPSANQSIISALHLPDAYLITGKFEDPQDFMSRLERALRQGVKLVQLRSKLSGKELLSLARQATKICNEYQAELLVNSNIELARQLDVGLHINSQNLMTCETRPVGHDKWFSASVHNEAELQQANKLGVDFIVISPVLPTQSHPGEVGLGWEAFEQLVSQASVPVYALGGMSAETLATATQKGAQGIAAISSFWKGA